MVWIPNEKRFELNTSDRDRLLDHDCKKMSVEQANRERLSVLKTYLKLEWSVEWDRP